MRVIFTVTYNFDDEQLQEIAEKNKIDMSEDNEEREDDLYSAIQGMSSYELEENSVYTEKETYFKEDDD